MTNTTHTRHAKVTRVREGANALVVDVLVYDHEVATMQEHDVTSVSVIVKPGHDAWVDDWDCSDEIAELAIQAALEDTRVDALVSERIAEGRIR